MKIRTNTSAAIAATGVGTATMTATTLEGLKNAVCTVQVVPLPDNVTALNVPDSGGNPTTGLPRNTYAFGMTYNGAYADPKVTADQR